MAFIVYQPAWKGRRAQAVTNAKARELLATLEDVPNDLTEDQYEYLACIEHIYLGKQQKKAELNLMETPDNLTNPGVLQGMSEQMPRGDRD